MRQRQPGGGGYFYQNCTWMCLPDVENPTFLPNFPPISIPFSKEKHPILTKLVLFTIIYPKYTIILLSQSCILPSPGADKSYNVGTVVLASRIFSKAFNLVDQTILIDDQHVNPYVHCSLHWLLSP